MPPSSLRTTEKWVSVPRFFHSDGTIGPSIWKQVFKKMSMSAEIKYVEHKQKLQSVRHDQVSSKQHD